MNQALSLLCERLGYVGEKGFLTHDALATAQGAVFALASARTHVDLVACFGAWESGFDRGGPARFVPLVYVVHAADAHDAERKHRWIWSQGVAPLAIISTSDSAYLCPGFAFPEQNVPWTNVVTHCTLDKLADSRALTGALADFQAVRLKASITWHDHKLVRESSVDRTLLTGLQELHNRLIASRVPGTALSPNLLNRLIGRVIYTFVLVDRGMLPAEWLSSKVSIRSSFSPRAHLHIADFWKLQDAIDDIFNGGVFQIARHERPLLLQEQLDLTIDFLKNQDAPKGPAVQYSLFQIDLSAIQVETLSAVYEKFLQTESKSAAEQDGVVYTPPFLVDFIVNRVSDDLDFGGKFAVLDPTAGSGIFLVAAYRRMIEARLTLTARTSMPLKQLRTLLVSSIFGVEKSRAAAEVAAFSLYLTLLEYADRDELRSALRRRQRERVFPPLFASNLRVADFYSKPNHFGSQKFRLALSNPPWKPLRVVSEHSESAPAFPVDMGDAAEQAVWHVLTNYLDAQGRAAFVLPSKSFASPSARTFAVELARAHAIHALVNLSHWRRHLFKEAEQPAALLFVAKQPPAPNARTWFYAPQLWTQPFRPKAMWTIALDAADLHSLPTVTAFATPDDVFDSFGLKPIDRAVKRRIRGAVVSQALPSFASLLDELGLKIGRGGSPKDTGLRADKIANAEALKQDRDDTETGRFGQLEVAAFFRLTQTDLKACRESFRPKFFGRRLILGRSMGVCFYVEEPVAVNSTFNVVYAPPGTKQPSAALLHNVGRFLMSGFVRYQFALFSRLWQIDKTRVETDDLLKIACPPREWFEQRDTRGLSPVGGTLDDELLDAMDFGDLREAFVDYKLHRSRFENGRVPSAAYDVLNRVPDSYLRTLATTIAHSLRLRQLPHTTANVVDGNAVELVIDFSSTGLHAIEASCARGTDFQCFDSSLIRSTSSKRALQLLKPAELSYFSMERAYSDALKIANVLIGA